MPAYRSDAEGEVRQAVVARLRLIRPHGRIIHEINTELGGNRIDVLCVSPSEMIAVEIKSAKDKLDRLPEQIKAMSGVAHHALAAIHEVHLEERETNEACSHYCRNGKFYMGELPIGNHGNTWVYPERQRSKSRFDFMKKWESPKDYSLVCLPHRALHMLWANELRELCAALNVSTGKRSSATDNRAALRWFCTGKELTRGICAALRARHCCEADPAVTTSTQEGE